MQDQERKISIKFKVKSQGHELTMYLEWFSTYVFNILYKDVRKREDNFRVRVISNKSNCHSDKSPWGPF